MIIVTGFWLVGLGEKNKGEADTTTKVHKIT